MKGTFITFEGPDGAGKTTQMKMLGEKLAAMGRQVIYTREPGGTNIGEKIRALLLEPSNTEMADKTEALLYSAARAQHVEELIKPALQEGKVVLCDRFTDSTIAYQGFGRGINIELLEELNKMAISGTVPDITFILDIDPTVGISRISNNRAVASGVEKDRIELEHMDFHKKVRDGFCAIAAQSMERYKVIDASKDREALHKEIVLLAIEVLK